MKTSDVYLCQCLGIGLLPVFLTSEIAKFLFNINKNADVIFSFFKFTDLLNSTHRSLWVSGP